MSKLPKNNSKTDNHGEIVELLYVAKGNNRRIHISLWRIKDKKHVLISTKTLTSFKDRTIFTCDTWYSLETFIIMSELLPMFREELQFKNSSSDIFPKVNLGIYEEKQILRNKKKQ
jgi:hypothetical protein